MNRIKFILLILISNSFLFYSCKNELVDNSEFIINLNFSNKDLNRIYYGNQFYKINGVNDYNKESSLNRPHSILILENKSSFIGNFQKISLFESPVKIYLHDLIEFEAIPVTINFNSYIKNKFYFVPTFSKDNLELLKNRSSKIYSLNSDYTLTPFFIDNLIYRDDEASLSDIKVYSNTIKNLKNLENIGLYPVSNEAIKFIHNPLSNLYSIYPDLSNFSTQKNNISKTVIDKINKHLLDTLNSKLKDYIITKDTLITKDLNLTNVNFKIEEGTSIKLSNNASIFINNSIIHLDGNENRQINILGMDNNSIRFSSCEKINIDYVNFNQLSNLERDSLNLTASVTFYNSNINITNSSFRNNVKGDDFVNFYNSRFKVTSTNFESIIADAIDSDFSKGIIANSNFINIGNDAIDFSGSISEVTNSSFFDIGDKSISVGENSNISIINSTFSNSELAIVVKDGSNLVSEKNKFKNNSIDYCAFVKKTFYKPPTLRILDYQNEKYLFQDNVNIFSKNNVFERVEDVESLLYGNIYGKASK